MKLTGFQKDVRDVLYDRINEDYTFYDEKICNTSDLVDKLFDTDLMDNSPMFGHTVSDTLKYCTDNIASIKDTVEEAKAQGFDFSSDFLENPNRFLITAIMEESKNLFARSSLADMQDFVMDDGLKQKFLDVVDNFERDITEQELVKDNTQSPYGKTCDFLKDYSYSNLYGRVFADTDELMDAIPELSEQGKKDGKDIFSQLHFVRMKNFTMHAGIAEDIHQTLGYKGILKDYELMAPENERKFEERAYGYYRQEQGRLPNILQDLSFNVFKRQVYDQTSYRVKKTTKWEKGNRILKDILPIMEYRRYEKYKGIPLDENLKLCRHDNGTLYKYDIGRTLFELDIRYKGDDKPLLEKAVNRSVDMFKRLEGDAGEYLREQGANPKLSKEGRELLLHIGTKYISKERERTVSRMPDMGPEIGGR